MFSGPASDVYSFERASNTDSESFPVFTRLSIGRDNVTVERLLVSEAELLDSIQLTDRPILHTMAAHVATIRIYSKAV